MIDFGAGGGTFATATTRIDISEWRGTRPGLPKPEQSLGGRPGQLGKIDLGLFELGAGDRVVRKPVGQYGMHRRPFYVRRFAGDQQSAVVNRSHQAFDQLE